MAPQLWRILGRWLVALGLIFFGLGMLTGAANEGMLGTFAHSLYAFAILISGVILLGPELISWLSAPISRFLSGLIFPDQRGIPPVDYTLARFYWRRESYAEAFEQYEKVIAYHPQELTAYLEAMEVARDAGWSEQIRAMSHLGQSKLRDERARTALREKCEFLLRSE